MFALSTVERGSISASGNSVAYLGFDGQVPGDSNGFIDVFVRQFAAEAVPDTVPPTVSGTPDRAPNAAGWYGVDVTIDWTATDPTPSSGTPTDPPNTLAGMEGTHAYASQPSCDPAGNCAIGSLTLSIDKTPPALGVPTWTVNPLALGTSTTVTVAATDATAGVTGGEYFVSTDPGPGSGTAMTWDGVAQLSATFGASLSPGLHTVGLRARDAAGHWSRATYDYLVVYDPAGPSDVAGKKSLLPVYQVDALPYLTQSGQTDEVHFGLAVRYLTGGQVDPASQFSFDYYVGFAGNKSKNCKLPNPADCHSTEFIATSFSWLTINGSNNSVGTFQGVGTLTIDGVSTTTPFRVVATDGSRLVPASGDSVALYVYAPGDDPTSDPPLHHVSGPPAGQGVTIG